jgi:hypothetical protein
MADCTNVGPRSGPLLARAGYLAIGVLQAPQAQAPIGATLATGQDEQGRALWSLTDHDILVPGPRIVVDREFRPAQAEARSSRSRGGQSPLTSSRKSS